MISPATQSAAERIRTTAPLCRVRRIIDAVAEASGVSAKAILSPSRRADHVRARDLVIWEINLQGRHSLSEIGRMMHRDHSTVHAAIQREARRRMEAAE